ncbi:hypothetical protein [Microlunatus ginsengisoli]|uniref:FtsK/SpoIIIE domain-containing protein n=1 Tax=Microlunatus ginsengisoli TaxID=363863 RepID=A0ABP6ZIB7_9ACTN
MAGRAAAVGRVLAAMVRGTGREAWFWLSGFAGLARRYRVAVVSSTGWLTVTAWQAWWQLFLLAAAPIMFFAGWCRVWPVSYTRRVSEPMWRRRVRRWVRKQWPMITDSCGLTRRTGQLVGGPVQVIVPRLARLRWQGGRLCGELELLPGQTVDQVEAAGDALRVTVSAHRIRIIPNAAVTGCGVAWTFGDPLAVPIPITVPAPDTPVDGLESIVLGVTEDGEPWRLPLRVPTFGAGRSGAGKSSLIQGMLIQLGPAIRAGLVEVCGIDLKCGVELAFAAPMLTRYATNPREAVVLLEQLVEWMEDRLARQAGISRDHTPSVAEPLVVVVVDELAMLTAYLTDRDLTRRGEAALSRLLSAGRAAGFVAHGFVQDPRKETVKMRHLFRQAVGLALREREEVSMVLSDGAVAAGAWCHKIPATTQGVGYVLGEADGRPVRVRGFLVTDDDIKLAAERFPAPRQHRIDTTLAEPEPGSTRAGGRARTRRKPATTTTATDGDGTGWEEAVS